MPGIIMYRWNAYLNITTTSNPAMNQLQIQKNSTSNYYELQKKPWTKYT